MGQLTDSLPERLQELPHVPVCGSLHGSPPGVSVGPAVTTEVLHWAGPEHHHQTEGAVQAGVVLLDEDVLQDDHSGGLGPLVSGLEVEEKISSKPTPALH